MYVRDIWPRESIARGSRESGEIVFRGLASFRIPRRGDGGGGEGGADDIVAIENNRRALISLAQARAAGMIPPRYVSTAEELYDGSTAHSLSLSLTSYLSLSSSSSPIPPLLLLHVFRTNAPALLHGK